MAWVMACRTSGSSKGARALFIAIVISVVALPCSATSPSMSCASPNCSGAKDVPMRSTSPDCNAAKRAFSSKILNTTSSKNGTPSR